MSLQVERLESRKLLAASVKVTGKGIVHVNGDDGDNHVVINNGVVGIDANGDGDYDDPDDVVQELTGQIRGFKVNLKDGDDLLIFRNSNFGSLNIKTGDGDDAVEVSASNVNGKSNINLGDGNDCFRIDASAVNAELKLNLGDGDDDFELFASLIDQKFSLKGGGGDDGVLIAASDMNGQDNINLGAQDDLFHVSGSSISGSGKFNGGKGEEDAFVSPNGMFEAALEDFGFSVKGFEQDFDFDLLAGADLTRVNALQTRLDACETLLEALPNVP